jgi:hypothetical protein
MTNRDSFGVFVGRVPIACSVHWHFAHFSGVAPQQPAFLLVDQTMLCPLLQFATSPVQIYRDDVLTNRLTPQPMSNTKHQ